MNPRLESVLEVRGLHKTYRQGKWWQKKFNCRALDNVSISLQAGKTLALIGESGCGKTTLAMCLVGLEKPDTGEILFDGKELGNIPVPQQILVRRDIQLIFQDSAGALNPRMSALEIVEEPLLINHRFSRAERSKLAEEMMERVEIPRTWKHRLPHEFSGGQRQRLAIARALVLKPQILILDEVFVGLDLSVQGQIANLLLDLQQNDGLTYLCISHNWALVGQMADTVAIMDKGRIVRRCSPAELSERWAHSIGCLPREPMAPSLAAGASLGT